MASPLVGEPEDALVGAYFRYELKQIGFRETGEVDAAKDNFERLFGRVPSIIMRLSVWDLRKLSDGAVDSYASVGSGYAGADRVAVELRVLSWEEGRYIVNYSVSFYNFSIYCFGKYCGPISAFFDNFEMGEGELRYYFSPLVKLSRVIAVDALTNDVLDPETGEGLGEWIVWLSSADVQRGVALVLASISYYVHAPLDGGGCVGAVLALVNFSAKHETDYIAGGIRVRRERTAVGLSHPPFIRWRRYGVRAAEELESSLEYFKPFGCKVVDYGNRTADMVCNKLAELYKGSVKAWRLGELLLGKKGRELVAFAKIEYAGLCAVSTPESHTFVYSTDGILLSTRQESPTFSLPSLLTYFWKRGHLAASLNTLGPYELNLVETNFILEYPELGGPGSADEAAHLTVTLLVVALACILLVVGWRR